MFTVFEKHFSVANQQSKKKLLRADGGFEKEMKLQKFQSVSNSVSLPLLFPDCHNSDRKP
jgi:hypothetical protein